MRLCPSACPSNHACVSVTVSQAFSASLEHIFINPSLFDFDFLNLTSDQFHIVITTFLRLHHLENKKQKPGS